MQPFPSWDEPLVRNIVQPVYLVSDVVEVTIACERLQSEAGCQVALFLDDVTGEWVCSVHHQGWQSTAQCETPAAALLSAVAKGWDKVS